MGRILLVLLGSAVAVNSMRDFLRRIRTCIFCLSLGLFFLKRSDLIFGFSRGKEAILLKDPQLKTAFSYKRSYWHAKKEGIALLPLHFNWMLSVATPSIQKLVKSPVASTPKLCVQEGILGGMWLYAPVPFTAVQPFLSHCQNYNVWTCWEVHAKTPTCNHLEMVDGFWCELT